MVGLLQAKSRYFIVTSSNRTHTLNQHMQSRVSLVQKTILVTMTAFVLSFLALASMTYMHLQDVAGTQHQQAQQQISTQIAKLSAPLILRHDLISLNVSLNELIDSNTIDGAAVYDANGRMLAKAGLMGNRDYNKFSIRNHDLVLGSLQVKIAAVNLQPSLQQLLILIWPSLIIMAILSLALGWWYGLRLYRPMQALHEAQEQLLL